MLSFYSWFGIAIGRQIMLQFCLPRSKVFVDHFPRPLFFFFVLLVSFYGGSKLLLKGKRVGEPSPMNMRCVLWQKSWLVKALEFINTKHASASFGARYRVSIKRLKKGSLSSVGFFSCSIYSFPVNFLVVYVMLLAF